MRDAIIKIVGMENIQAIVSHSLGGAAAIWAEKQHKKHLKTVVIAPPVTAAEIMKTFMSKIRATNDILPAVDAYTLKKFGLPFRHYTLELLAEGIHEFPLLIFHDQNDRDSPLSESKLLKEKMPFAELQITQKLGHNRILHDPGVGQKILDFLS